MESLIKKYIAYPMAITVFKQDKEKFLEFKLGNLYLDMLESVIAKMEQDFYQLKSELISIHHLEVRRIENGEYNVNGKLIEFSPEELKEMTSELMSQYLHGDKATKFERKDRVWNDD